MAIVTGPDFGCRSLQSCPGLEQYAIKKFAEAFEALPRALAENSGVKGNELVSKLYAAHHEGNKNIGFDIEVRSGRGGTAQKINTGH